MFDWWPKTTATAIATPKAPKDKWDITTDEALEKYGSALAVVKELAKEPFSKTDDQRIKLLFMAVVELSEKCKCM